MPADAGDVIYAPAHAELRVDTGAVSAAAWVTATAGLEAVLQDGTRLVPPRTL